MERCEVCGLEAAADEIDVMHRACRLRAAFPGAVMADQGDGLLRLDVEKIKGASGHVILLEWAGWRMEFWPESWARGGGRIVISGELKKPGNEISRVSWFIEAEDFEKAYHLYRETVDQNIKEGRPQ